MTGEKEKKRNKQKTPTQTQQQTPKPPHQQLKKKKTQRLRISWFSFSSVATCCEMMKQLNLRKIKDGLLWKNKSQTYPAV